MSDLQYALDRMSTALDASRLSGATADEDARCMSIIRAEIERLRAERDDLRRQLAEAAESIARQAATIRGLTRPAEE